MLIRTGNFANLYCLTPSHREMLRVEKGIALPEMDAVTVAPVGEGAVDDEDEDVKMEDVLP